MDQIKKLVIEKLDVMKVKEVTAEVPATATVNLCEKEVVVGEEMVIDYTYTDLERQVMILNI